MSSDLTARAAREAAEGVRSHRRLSACRYTYTAKLEVQHMIDTTWIMSPRPVVPWGLRKALNWVSSTASSRRTKVA